MRTTIAVICLAALGLLVWVAATRVGPTFEQELSARAATAASAIGPELVVAVVGRDLTVSGPLPAGASRAQLLAALSTVAGAGEVDASAVVDAEVATVPAPEVAEVEPPAPDGPDANEPSVPDVAAADEGDAAEEGDAADEGDAEATADVGDPLATAPDAAAPPGPVPSAPPGEEPLDLAALDATEANAPQARVPPGPTAALATSAPPAGPSSGSAPGSSGPAAASAVASGPLDAKACRERVRQMTLDRALRIGFPIDGVSLAPEGLKVLAQFAAVLARCPEVPVAVEGYHHDLGNPDRIRALTRQRAEAVIAALGRLGVAVGRLTPVGRGYLTPRYRNNDAERHLNERVELKLGGK